MNRCVCALCSFSAAGDDDLLTRCDGRRLISAKARNRGAGSRTEVPQAMEIWRRGESREALCGTDARIREQKCPFRRLSIIENSP